MLKARSSKSLVKNEKGMAIMELIPIMIIIILLFNFSLGFFGAIHTGILNSMSARNYAFETFRHRSNLMYLRTSVDANSKVSYQTQNMRIHATVSDKMKSDDRFVATGRPIDFLAQLEATGSRDIHNTQVYSVKDGKRFTDNSGVNPLWVRPQYGICLNAKCAPN
ncbi:hypothetical protein [Bdellovibrio sp. HCB337]|uniref:hypothetical protein n=1 Tax=Bdellovibrio sp. HCB337 TaxID=3394358 RepID=UPI0039A73E07